MESGYTSTTPALMKQLRELQREQAAEEARKRAEQERAQSDDALVAEIVALVPRLSPAHQRAIRAALEQA